MDDMQLCPLFKDKCKQSMCTWFAHEDTGCCVPFLIEVMDVWLDDVNKDCMNIIAQHNEILKKMDQ